MDPPDPPTPPLLRFHALPPERLLLALAGSSALAFGLLAFLLQLSEPGEAPPVSGFGGIGGLVFSFAVTVCFGLLLLLATALDARRPAEAGVLGLAFSLVLLLFGGKAGIIAGVLGVAGSLLAFARHVRWIEDAPVRAHVEEPQHERVPRA